VALHAHAGTVTRTLTFFRANKSSDNDDGMELLGHVRARDLET
jgi:hypothetical protein